MLRVEDNCFCCLHREKISQYFRWWVLLTLASWAQQWVDLYFFNSFSSHRFFSQNATRILARDLMLSPGMPNFNLYPSYLLLLAMLKRASQGPRTWVDPTPTLRLRLAMHLTQKVGRYPQSWTLDPTPTLHLTLQHWGVVPSPQAPLQNTSGSVSLCPIEIQSMHCPSKTLVYD